MKTTHNQQFTAMKKIWMPLIEASYPNAKLDEGEVSGRIRYTMNTSEHYISIDIETYTVEYFATSVIDGSVIAQAKCYCAGDTFEYNDENNVFFTKEQCRSAMSNVENAITDVCDMCIHFEPNDETIAAIKETRELMNNIPRFKTMDELLADLYSDSE